MPDPVIGSRVAAVVELQDGADVTVDELLDHAGQRLRSFMVPELVFFTDAIPRNELGKISRQDLATIYAAGPVEPGSEHEPDAALDAPDDLVAAVLDVYGHVLGRTVVDPESSFFDLGADSLHTLYLHLELEQRFGVAIQPALFARDSSASALAAYVRSNRSASRSSSMNSSQATRARPSCSRTRSTAPPGWRSASHGRSWLPVVGSWGSRSQGPMSSTKGPVRSGSSCPSTPERSATCRRGHMWWSATR